MATHKEIRGRKQECYDFIFNVVRTKNRPVRLNDLHEFFGDVWKQEMTFIQEVIANAPGDIALDVRRKRGSFAVFVDPSKITAKQARKAVARAQVGPMKKKQAKARRLRKRNASRRVLIGRSA